ncbi:GL18446 [Drosophila persimilis]|uniref:GL18446 n=1 Tax=Drosophila persimilis TaxID=7234 RepID=B4HCQ8_DROPE|nr:GL18446 [Drosophila persimilis]
MSNPQRGLRLEERPGNILACGICVREIEDPAQCFKARCNHTFHFGCFRNRGGEKTVCPVCFAYLETPAPNLAEELEWPRNAGSQAETGVMPRTRSQGMGSPEPEGRYQVHASQAAEVPDLNVETVPGNAMPEGLAQMTQSLTQAMAQIAQMAQAMAQMSQTIDAGFQRLASQDMSPRAQVEMGMQIGAAPQTFEQLFQIPPKESVGPANNGAQVARSPWGSQGTIEQEEEEELNEVVEDPEIAAVSLLWWNCGGHRHRYQECVAERKVFSYGCGRPETYKPSCSRCNASKNLKGRAPLVSARKQVSSRGTDTDQ